MYISTTRNDNGTSSFSPPSFLPSVQKEGSFLREIMEMEDNNTREENVEMRKEENSETRFEH